MEKLITTDHSFLSIQDLPTPDLLPRCVEEIQGKLIERPPIMVYGKLAHQHRNIGFFSNVSKGYQYSGQLAASQPLTPSLTELLEMVNRLYGAEFNGILLNQYMDGSDYIGPHSDDERHLDPVGVVAVSYGAIRNFRIRDKSTKKIVKDVPMEPGRVIHMAGKFQQEFTHEIPVQKTVQGVRYSFTFRRHLE